MITLAATIAAFLHISLPTGEGCPSTIVAYPSTVAVKEAIKVANGAYRYCNRARNYNGRTRELLPYCATRVTIVKHSQDINHMGVKVKCLPKVGPSGEKV